MEIQAVIEGLKKINELSNCGEKNIKVTVFTDSKYIVDTFKKGWIDDWIKNKWRKANNEHVKNKDLWIELFEQTKILYVNFKWLKGHNGQADNELCDKMAVEQIDNFVLGNSTIFYNSLMRGEQR